MLKNRLKKPDVDIEKKNTVRCGKWNKANEKYRFSDDSCGFLDFSHSFVKLACRQRAGPRLRTRQKCFSTPTPIWLTTWSIGTPTSAAFFAKSGHWCHNFQFTFCKKKPLWISVEGKSTPHWGEYCSLLFLSGIKCVSVSDFWSALWADRAPHEGPHSWLVRCFRDFKDAMTQSGDMCGAKIPGHHHQ